MLKTSSTATIPKYVPNPPKNAPASNRSDTTRAPNVPNAAATSPLWNELENGTERAKSTSPVPRKMAVAKVPGTTASTA